MNKNSLKGLKSSSIVQIGFGRLGVHLYKHLNSFFKDPIHLSIGEDQSKKLMKNPEVKYIFLAVPDSKILNYINKIPKKIKIIHFSGFYFYSKAAGIHPVQSFSKKSTYDFNKIDFVTDKKLDEFLKIVFKKNQFINPENKKKYHTYLSVTANSLQLLMNQLGDTFQKETDIPKEILKKITIQSLSSELLYKKESFSGPWTRNERKPQEKEVAKYDNNTLKELNEMFKKLIARHQDECAKI